MNRKRIRGLHARVGLLATALALAAALVAGSWMNYRSARDAVTTLHLGQFDLIEVQLRDAFPPWESTPERAELQRFMDSIPELGIRYIAILGTDGEVIASAGTATVPAAAAPQAGAVPGAGPRMAAAGDRVRAYSARPAPRDPSAGRGFARIPRTALTVVEFEPVVAATLVNRAWRSLALGGLAAILLTFAAVAFWAFTAKFEAEREQTERQRRLSQLGEMSAVLAHEIRNPLASLKGNAQLLAERLDPQSRDRQRADRVVHEATRLQALTSDLLDFARSGPIDLAPVDPAELLRTAADEVGDPRTRLETTSAPARWTLDAARMRQALVNLLRNAAQVTPEDRPLEAQVRMVGGRLVFSISDHGPGLPEGDLQRIFEPFFTTRTTGTGLGLAVARRAAEMHGGRIDATNRGAGGAEFRITLPEVGT